MSETTRAAVSQPGFCPAWRSVTTSPQIQPVTAPNAPVSDATRKREAPEQAPLRLDAHGVEHLPGQARGRSQHRWRRRGGAATHRADGGVVVVVLLHGHLVGGRLEQPAERPVTSGQPATRPLLDDATRLEDGDLLGPLGRREAVGDEDAGAPRDQPVRGPDHSGLGDRVHAGRGLVEHDDAHVAHEQPGERHELLLARRERRAARAEHRVQAVGQPGHPLGEAQLGDRGLDPGTGHVTEERHVLGEGAGEHLGALGDDADRGPQLLQVEVAHVGASQQHRAAGRLHRPRQQRGERGLAGAGAPDERAGVSRRDDEVDVPERECAGAVAELEVAELHVERPVGQRQAAGRLRRRGEHGPQPQDRTEALLQVGQVTREHVDTADEHRRDEEEGDEPGGRQIAGEHEGGARRPRRRPARRGAGRRCAG